MGLQCRARSKLLGAQMKWVKLTYDYDYTRIVLEKTPLVRKLLGGGDLHLGSLFIAFGFILGDL